MTPDLAIKPEALALYLRCHCMGISQARSGKQIATYFGIKETKRVREVVNLLRQQGQLIGSCHAGYFIPVNREEALIALGFITALFEPMRRAVEGYRGAMEREFGAEQLFDMEVAS